MSLNEMLKTIRNEAEAEAKKIRKEGEAELKKVEQELEELNKKNQEKILGEFRMNMEKKVKQAKFLKESASKTKNLQKKQEILDKVYEKVIDKVMNDKVIYDKVMKKAVEQLPRVTGAKIVLAKEESAETRKILGSKYNFSKETVEARGGFVLESGILRIDDTVETLINQVRSETEMDVARILFGGKE